MAEVNPCQIYVIYPGDFPGDALLNMIGLACETVFNSFGKSVQKQMMEEV